MPERGGPHPAQGTVAQARLFVALWPEPQVQQRLAAWRDRWVWPKGASGVTVERLHLTVHFIGAVPLARVPEIAQALEAPGVAFELEEGRAECWRNGIAAWCPAEVPPALLDLHRRLAVVLKRLALPVERRALRPHVTLARRAARAVPPPDVPPPLRWRVSGHALVRSAGGYQVLRRYR